MNAFYESLITRARGPCMERVPLSDTQRQEIVKLMTSILRLAEYLKVEGLLVSDFKRFDDPHFVEYQWSLSESKRLVARGFGLVGSSVGGYARVAIGVKDESSSFIEVTACGLYASPWLESDESGIHKVILEGFADLVAQYRN
jgi:hypothetical protein